MNIKSIIINLALIALITFLVTYNAIDYYFEQYGMTDAKTSYFCEPSIIKLKCQKVLLPDNADSTFD